MSFDPQQQETRRLRDRQPQRRGDYYIPREESSRRPPARRPRPPRSGNGLYLPLWSVLLMLVIVIAAAAGVIALIVTAGGRDADGGDPVVIIVTAAPSSTPLPNAAPTNAAAPTFSIDANTPVPGSFPTFALEGPTLPPVVLSPTPIQIAVGLTVAVNSSVGLNIRVQPAGAEITRVNDGALFTVIDGPQSAELDGSPYQWWRLRSLVDPALEGWAAADFLEVQP